MRHPALEVARKELVEVLRDRRSLAVLVLLPAFLYPLLCVGVVMAATAQLRALAAETHRVWVDDLEALPPGLRAALVPDEAVEAPPAAVEGGEAPPAWRLELAPLPPGTDVDEALLEGRVDAVLKGVPRLADLEAAAEAPALEVLYDEGLDASRLTMERVRAGVAAWARTVAAERVRAAGLPSTTLRPVEVRVENRGPAGALLGRLLATVLVILALTGAYYPALDLGAGEKERGTLETLLLAPVSRGAVALGKYLAVLCVASGVALAHLVSLGATVTGFAATAPPELALEVSPLVVLPILLALFPLVALFAGLALAVSTFAASYKEGQAYLTPLILLGSLPPLAAALPGLQLTPALALVPVAGAALLVKGLLVGTAGFGSAVLVSVASLGWAALAVRWAASLYEREDVLFRPAAAPGPDLLGLRPRRPGQARPTLPQAAVLGAGVVLLVALAGPPLQGWSLPWGLALTLVGLVAGPAVAYAALLRAGPREAFGLTRPPGLALLGALLLGPGAAGLALEVAWLQRAWAGPPTPEEARAMEAAAATLFSLPTPLLFGLLAVLPAVAEELVFRGFVLRGLQRGGGPLGAVLVSAVLFALAHLDPARLLPTFAMGIVLAAVALRTGSLWPSVLLHAAYNASAVAAQRYGFLSAWLDDHRPGWELRLVSAALAAAGLGLVLVARRRGPTAAA